MSLLLLFNQVAGAPPVAGTRWVLPLGGVVSLSYPWGTETTNIAGGSVTEATRRTGAVTLTFPWGNETTNPTGGAVDESTRSMGIVGKVP